MGICAGGRAGMASTRRTWQPTSRVGVGLGDGDGIAEERGRGHEGRGGERVALVEFGDGAIDAGGEAEVVGVDDEGHED